MATDHKRSVAVVGSGAGGVAAAFRLHEAGFHVRLLEKDDRVGGRMHTIRRDGFMIEEGATFMARSYTSILGVVRDAGLSDEIVPASSVFGFPGPDGTVHEIDTGRIVRSGLATKLVSQRAKFRFLRLAAEIIRYRSRLDVEDLSLLCELDTMSAQEYGRKLMGDELFDYIGDPCVRTFVGCASAEVSAVDLIFAFAKFLTGETFVAFRDGMQSYPERLISRSGLDLALGVEVLGVTERADGVELRSRDGAGGERLDQFDGVVLACDANAASRIHTGLDPWRREFLRDEVRYSSMTSCSVAVDSPPDIRSCYIFPPVKTHPNMPVIALEHTKVGGRVPPGKGLVSLFPPSEISRALYDEPDDIVAKTLIEAAEPFVPGLSGSVLWTYVSRKHPCVMQSRPGYWTQMREFRSRGATEDRRVRLAGDYFCASNVNTASVAGERAARELIAHLT